MKPIYHSGQIAVQERAGVRALAEHVGQSIVTHIPPRARDFVLAQPMAILGTLDAGGRVWASLLTGAPGFMSVIDDRMLTVDARAVAGDPLAENLGRTEDVGVLIIEPSTRRRMRLNGKIEIDRNGVIGVQVEHVYSNCPKYIQARQWRIEPNVMPASSVAGVERTHTLNIRQQQWIARSDTFFIASHHPAGSADASHRGGNPGFVRIKNGRLLAWDDYPGNNMFQTLGNIHSYPRAGLLFLDFETGDTLQLTGTAEVRWDGISNEGQGSTGRSVEFEIDEVVQIARGTDLRWRFLSYSPFNPA